MTGNRQKMQIKGEKLTKIGEIMQLFKKEKTNRNVGKRKEKTEKNKIKIEK